MRKTEWVDEPDMAQLEAEMLAFIDFFFDTLLSVITHRLQDDLAPYCCVCG